MGTRSHIHEMALPCTPEEAFDLLVTPSAIRAWWQAARAVVVPVEGGAWAAAWGDEEDAPEYVTSARIEVYDPPRRLLLVDYVYVARDDPRPFDADFRTEFTVRADGDGCALRVVQDGFPTGPEADAFYAACETGWRDTFAGIHRFVAGG